MGLFLLNFAGPVNSATTQGTITESKLLCHGPNKNYTCDSGYCCESQCCSHYYELWWFWLVWTIIIILICCCVCHHRRTKHRLQQQQRQHEINLIAYREAHNYTSLPFYLRFLPSYLLPAYEEVVNRPPTPPPPYSPAQTVVTEVCSSPTQIDQPEAHCLQGPSSLSGPGVPSATSTSSPELQQQQLQHLPVSNLRRLGDEGKLITGAPGEGRQQQRCQPPVPLLLAGEGPLARGGKARDCCKELGCEPLGCPPSSPLDDKDHTPGRHRRFTGDSGIEVCVCSRGVGEDEEEEDSEEQMKELERLMDVGENEDEEAALRQHNFCDSCQTPSGLVSCGNPQAPSGDEVCGDSDGLEQTQPLHVPHHHPHQQQQQQEQHGLASVPRSPVCLHLHTINEQDGSHGHGSTENQS